ncbi:MAG TPA: hypothetical protein VGD71_12680 [Kribbella sp.]
MDELRDVDVRDVAPAGYGPNPPIPAVYESGGTTGAPKRVILMPDWEEQFTAWYAADLLEQPGLRDSGLLMVGPSGPHMFGQWQRRVAALLNSVLFTIDLDPRWLKKLVARGAVDQAAAYVDHILEQAGDIVRTQDVTVLTTTPPLQAIARDDDLVDVINDKVLRIEGGGAHFDEDTRAILREIFPNAKVRNIYGSTMIWVGRRPVRGCLRTTLSYPGHDNDGHQGRDPGDELPRRLQRPLTLRSAHRGIWRPPSPRRLLLRASPTSVHRAAASFPETRRGSSPRSPSLALRVHRSARFRPAERLSMTPVSGQDRCHSSPSKSTIVRTPTFRQGEAQLHHALDGSGHSLRTL